ncbi:MAG: thiamine phosphate synthase [Terriglobales bacterium]
MTLPKLYAIADRSCFADSESLYAFVKELLAAGVTLIQYRNKEGSGRQMLQEARELRRIVSPTLATPATSGHSPTLAKEARVGHPIGLIMNDRADLALAAGFDGVHVGQNDLSPEAVRSIIGPHMWLGVSTHNPEQIAAADKTDSDYLAIGPVFATSSKENTDPVIGLEGVRRARELTRKPLVAIGGITCERASEVIAAGVDSVAVISALLRETRNSAEDILRRLA